MLKVQLSLVKKIDNAQDLKNLNETDCILTTKDDRVFVKKTSYNYEKDIFICRSNLKEKLLVFNKSEVESCAMIFAVIQSKKLFDREKKWANIIGDSDFDDYENPVKSLSTTDFMDDID